MASMLFSTIGQAVGGPLAAGVGAAVGATVDAALFRKGRPGASDLYVQRSAYGAILPRLYGTTRVAGHLIWALPLAAGGQSKGMGRQSSATSFAIALCAGPILGIRRVWADGREIRDVDGRFEIATEMRVHQAGNTSPDTLIAASEGLDVSPAFQGLSYVVFENFGLAPFGNRIPNLSFEVVADEVGADGWLEDYAALSGTSAAPGGPQAMATGFVATAETPSDDLQILATVAGANPSLADGRFSLRGVPRVFEIAADELLATGRWDSGRSDNERPTRHAGEKPSKIAIDYLDTARDYQAGRQSASRARTGRALGASWALCASAEVGQQLAQRLLRRAETGAEELTFNLSWRWLEVTVGDLVQIGDGPLWRIVNRDVRGLMLVFRGERVDQRNELVSVAADPGRNLPARFTPAPATLLIPFEPPVPLQGVGAKLLIIGAGPAAWRGAEISVLSGGEEIAVGRAGRGSLSGRLLEPLAPGQEALWDAKSAVLLDVGTDAAMFQTRSEADVLAGANLLRVGEELLQFRAVEIVDSGTVRLSGLLRGRYGTGFRAVGAPAGAGAVLVKPGTHPELHIEEDRVGREIVLLANGAGDPPGGTEAVHQVDGVGLAPMGPVHLRAIRSDDGGVRSSWIARHREIWSWGSGPDPVPPAFVWRHLGDDALLRSVPVEGHSLNLSAAEQQFRFGSVLPVGSLWVEAVGNGPLPFRRSRSVRV